jgi:hypothetical protein
MEGRAATSRGEAAAARYIAAQLGASRLDPAGDSGGYFQYLPVAMSSVSRRQPGGGTRASMEPVLFPSFAALDTIPADRRLRTVNVVGLLRGADPRLSSEVVLVGAHFDHEGIGRPVNGDSIYNGADDDASGVVTVLETARILAAGPRPRRTVVFALFTGEEIGGFGSRWYVDHPARPFDRHIAQLQVEMVGRPDSLAGGPGKTWLTGFERSTMGESFAAAGLPVVADPRPRMQFYQRSDNIIFARRGVIAHTLSSYNMHEDYHTPDDEVERVDFDHMARVIDVAARAVRLLADGPGVEWKAGGRP